MFIDGEGFAYLGRSYRLRLVPESDAAVKLVGGRFVMPKALARDGREHLIRWYCERAQAWLAGKVAGLRARMEVCLPACGCRTWATAGGHAAKATGSISTGRRSCCRRRIAEYVVVHEMAHLHEPHHTPEYWRRVERAMPDFERRKALLASCGGAVEGL